MKREKAREKECELESERMAEARGARVEEESKKEEGVWDSRRELLSQLRSYDGAWCAMVQEMTDVEFRLEDCVSGESGYFASWGGLCGMHSRVMWQQIAESKDKRVAVTDCTMTGFAHLMDYIHGLADAQVIQSLSAAQLVDTMHCARVYGVQALERMCCDALARTEQVHLIAMLDRAEQLKLTLTDEMKQLVNNAQFLQDALLSDDLKHSPLSLLAAAVECDARLLDEESLWIKCRDWAKATAAASQPATFDGVPNEEQWKHVIKPLLVHIRFPLMSQSFFSDEVVSSGVLDPVKEVVPVFQVMAGSRDIDCPFSSEERSEIVAEDAEDEEAKEEEIVMDDEAVIASEDVAELHRKMARMAEEKSKIDEQRMDVQKENDGLRQQVAQLTEQLQAAEEEEKKEEDERECHDSDLAQVKLKLNFCEEMLMTMASDVALEDYRRRSVPLLMDERIGSGKWKINALLFRASVDGFGAGDFHGKCDGKGPTLTMILNHHGCVFGGFAQAGWESGSGTFKTDSKAWLFACRITEEMQAKYPALQLPVSFAVVEAVDAIYCYPDKGPVFGRWSSIAIVNNCNTNNRNHCNLGVYYSNQIGDIRVCSEFLSGTEYFKVVDYCVYSVTLTD